VVKNVKNRNHYIPAVLRYLSFRDRSAHEIETYLIQLIKEPEQKAATIQQIMDYLHAEHLIDDAHFARQWVEVKVRRFQGPLKIKAALAARGVSRDIIDQALLAIEAETWIAAACELIEKKAAQWGSLANLANYAKAARYLASRGFLPGHCRAAIDLWRQNAVK
jgi:SOS response regulatory protein OraA/RecX